MATNLHQRQSHPAGLRLIGLVRVSSKEQAAEDRARVDPQYETIKRIARQHGVPDSRLVIKTAVDVSGSDLSQTDLWRNDILPELQSPTTHLAVDDVVRLLRPDNLDYSVAHHLWQTNTYLYTSAGRIDPHSENGLIQIIIGGLIGGSEKKRMKRMVWGSKEAKRRRGEFPQSHICLATGISYDRDTRAWGYNQDAHKVREAFHLLAEEGETNLEGIGRMVGGPDSPVLAPTIVSWLRNPIYKGLMVYDEKRGMETYAPRTPGQQPDRRKVQRRPEEIIEVRVFGGDDQEPQLVADDVWEAAQIILDQRSHDHRKRRMETQELVPYSTVLFSIFGGENYRDHILYGRSEHRGRHVRYVCRCRTPDRYCQDMERCELRRLPAELVNQALDEFLVRITQDEWFTDNVILPQMRDQGPSIDEEITRLKADTQAVEAKLERLQDGWVDGKLTDDYYQSRLDRLQRERRQLESYLARAYERRAAAGTEEMEDRVREYMAKLGRFEPGHPVGFRRGFLRQLIPEIIVSNEGIELLTLRVPQGVGGTPETLRAVWGITWEELLGYGLGDAQAQRRAQGLYTTVMLAERLGKKPDWVRHKIKTGRIPHPPGRHRNGKMWTEAEVEAVEKILAEPEPPEPVYRWGLPKKERYTSGDVCRALGIEWGRLRYLLGKGVLPDCQERRGRIRQWTEDEIEAVVAVQYQKRRQEGS